MYKEQSKSQVYAIVQYIEQYLLEFYFIFMNYQNSEQHIYVGKKITDACTISCYCQLNTTQILSLIQFECVLDRIRNE